VLKHTLTLYLSDIMNLEFIGSDQTDQFHLRRVQENIRFQVEVKLLLKQV